MNLVKLFLKLKRVIRHAYNTVGSLEDIRNTNHRRFSLPAIRNTDNTHFSLGNKRITMKSRAVHSFSKAKSQNGLILFLSILVFMTVVSCKKDKGIVNVEWQNESLGLTAEICAKYRECADKEWKTIPENLKKFTEGRLEETQCQKRFRESNAYKLIGADPLAIQTAYKDCHKQILQFSCKDLQEGKIDTVSSCLVFLKVQNGN